MLPESNDTLRIQLLQYFIVTLLKEIPMLTSAQCLKKYGPPELEKAMVLFDIPTKLELGVIPKKIYCNKDLVAPLTKALTLIIAQDLIPYIKTWDGCFNIRKKRNGGSISLHSWGVAIDINAAWNKQGRRPTMDLRLVDCFKEAGFDWGGDWLGNSVDGMHFQLAKI